MATKKLFADVLQGYLAEKKTGALFVSVAEASENLIRFFFKDGDIYSLSYGPIKDKECLDIRTAMTWGKSCTSTASRRPLRYRPVRDRGYHQRGPKSNKESRSTRRKSACIDPSATSACPGPYRLPGVGTPPDLFVFFSWSRCIKCHNLIPGSLLISLISHTVQLWQQDCKINECYPLGRFIIKTVFDTDQI